MEPGPPEPTEPFRIVVTGWRYWFDFRRIQDALVFQLADHGQFLLGVGDCPTGADDIATRWGAVHLDWPVTQYRAPWERRGKAGGPIRNKFMIDQHRPGLVLAFIHPVQSRGTVNCANYAESQGIAVRRFFERGSRDLQLQAHDSGPDFGRIRGIDAQVSQEERLGRPRGG